MSLTLKKGYKQLLAEAETSIETISAADAIILKDDPSVVIVDIRDAHERQQTGYIANSLHAPRGMLEFLVDPESPFHKEIFASGKRFVLHCASGGRSALAARTLKDMGLPNVCHIQGGLKSWIENGGLVEH